MRFAGLLGVTSILLCTFASGGHAAAPNDPHVATSATASASVDANAPKPIEARDVFWGDKHGELQHELRLFQDGRVLEGADQYRAVDRPDLARLYQDRMDRGSAQRTIGGVLVVGGLIAMAAGAAADGCSRDAGCQTHDATGVIAAGLGGAVIGGLLMLVVPDPRPISDPELQRLIDAHNRRAQQKASPPLGVAPFVGAGSKPGLALEAAF